MSTLFQISSLVVMPFWLMMIFLPKWQVTEKIMRSLLVVVPMALLYGILVIPKIPSLMTDLANPQLEAIREILSSPEGATIGWIHFLAFDLFVGRWIYLEGREKGFPVLLLSVCLFFTLMFGPLGLLCYLGLRYWRLRT